MLIYATPLSSIALRVRIAVAYKGLPVEFRPPPGGYRSDAYRRIVPASTVPALVDGDFVLAESDAIIEYLDEIVPRPSLLPGNAKARAATRMLSRLHDFRVEPPLRALLLALSPAASRGDGDATRRHLAALQAGLDVMSRSARPAPFLSGPTLSLADCAIPATMILARRLAPALGLDFVAPSWLPAWQRAFCETPPLRALFEGYETAIDGWIAEKLAAS